MGRREMKASAASAKFCLPVSPVAGERDVAGPLVHGELELEVLGELAARTVADAPVAYARP